MIRRIVALFVFLVIVGGIAATAWALLGDGGGTASGNGGSGNGNAAAGDGNGSGSGGGSGGGSGSGSGSGAGGDSASPSPSKSPTSGKPKVITIGWAGDTTPGSKYGNPPNSGQALFANVRTQLSAPDLMMVNLEGTYSTATTDKSYGSNSANVYCFQAPPSYAKALTWAGIDMVSVANNHSHDYLEVGLQQTQDALEAVGVEYTGLPKQFTIVDVKGVSVAAIGFSPYPWNNDVNNLTTATKLVRQADEKADLVVVLFHGGAEGADLVHTPNGTEYAFGENRGNLRAFAHACIDAGADLVLGSGPHVIRGIERYKHRLVAYSLGNFGGWDNFGTGGNLSLSGLLTVKIDSTGAIRGGRWLSLYLAEPGVPTVDGNNSAANLVRQLSAADFSATFKMSADGSFGSE